MKCDNCGEDIMAAVIRRPDGTVQCHACAKREKIDSRERKRAKSDDKFVMMARRLRDIGAPYDFQQVILKHGSGRIYTDGNFLMTETLIMPKSDYKLIDIDLLWEADREKSFPDIEKVLDRGFPYGVIVNIPKEFYSYIRPFTTPRPRRYQVRVVFDGTGIRVVDTRDHSSMWFGENLKHSMFDGGAPVPVPAFERSVSFDLRYFEATKPEELLIPLGPTLSNGARPASWILTSYEKAFDSCAAVLLQSLSDKDVRYD